MSDDPNTLDAAWTSFEKGLLRGKMLPDWIQTIMKLTFYAGASAGLSILLTNHSDSPEAAYDDIAKLAQELLLMAARGPRN